MSREIITSRNLQSQHMFSSHFERELELENEYEFGCANL